MIRITLINCKSNLESQGIYLEDIGAGETFSRELSKVTDYMSWEYDFRNDLLYICITDSIEIPDLSSFGEVLSNDYIA